MGIRPSSIETEVEEGPGRKRVAGGVEGCIQRKVRRRRRRKEEGRKG